MSTDFSLVNRNIRKSLIKQPDGTYTAEVREDGELIDSVDLAHRYCGAEVDAVDGKRMVWKWLIDPSLVSGYFARGYSVDWDRGSTEFDEDQDAALLALVKECGRVEFDLRTSEERMTDFLAELDYDAEKAEKRRAEAAEKHNTLYAAAVSDAYKLRSEVSDKIDELNAAYLPASIEARRIYAGKKRYDLDAALLVECLLQVAYGLRKEFSIPSGPKYLFTCREQAAKLAVSIFGKSVRDFLPSEMRGIKVSSGPKGEKHPEFKPPTCNLQAEVNNGNLEVYISGERIYDLKNLASLR